MSWKAGRTGAGETAVVWLLVMLVLGACSPKIVIDYDKSADFSKYHTYTWGQGTPAKNPLMDRRIVEAIDQELSRKGYQKVDSQPDMQVSYHAALEDEIIYNTTAFGYGYGPGWGPGYGRYGGGTVGVSTATSTPTKVTLGTVVVDIYDANEKRMIWRGVGNDQIGDDPEKTTALIQKGAAKMFESFPPPEK